MTKLAMRSDAIRETRNPSNGLALDVPRAAVAPGARIADGVALRGWRVRPSPRARRRKGEGRDGAGRPRKAEQWHVSQHQDPAQLQAAGDRGGDPCLRAAVRAQAERLCAALQGE